MYSLELKQSTIIVLKATHTTTFSYLGYVIGSSFDPTRNVPMRDLPLSTDLGRFLDRTWYLALVFEDNHINSNSKNISLEVFTSPSKYEG